MLTFEVSSFFKHGLLKPVLQLWRQLVIDKKMIQSTFQITQVSLQSI